MTEVRAPKLYPDIDVFPACSKCGVAYVLRRGTVLNFKTGDLSEKWVWQRDCQPKRPCMKAPAELVNADGTKYEAPDDGEVSSEEHD